MDLVSLYVYNYKSPIVHYSLIQFSKVFSLFNASLGVDRFADMSDSTVYFLLKSSWVMRLRFFSECSLSS